MVPNTKYAIFIVPTKRGTKKPLYCASPKSVTICCYYGSYHKRALNTVTVKSAPIRPKYVMYNVYNAYAKKARKCNIYM